VSALIELPKIIGAIDVVHDAVKILVGDQEYEVTSGDVPAPILGCVLRRFDGTASVVDVVAAEPTFTPKDAANLLDALDHIGLVDDEYPADYISGPNLIRELETLIEEHCDRTIHNNPFWRKCLAVTRPGDLPEKLATGMVIENWHFLFRESYFDAPVLSFVSNTVARLEMNKFFSEEYGHDEIMLRSLNSVGLTREDMRDAIPLPETMCLCNGLAYWAHTDPLFFFATLGLLEGQGLETDSFIKACEKAGFPEQFVAPLKTHSNINIDAGHGNLTRELFAHFPVISRIKANQMRKQIPLFVELYDNFYSGVWRYYMSDQPLLRRTTNL
jgi:Iron-containing redox enzyme